MAAEISAAAHSGSVTRILIPKTHPPPAGRAHFARPRKAPVSAVRALAPELTFWRTGTRAPARTPARAKPYQDAQAYLDALLVERSPLLPPSAAEGENG